MPYSEATSRALSFLAQRLRDTAQLVEVDLRSTPVYGFDPAHWFVLAVVEKDSGRVGAVEHIAVNKISGEVRSLGFLGE